MSALLVWTIWSVGGAALSLAPVEGYPAAEVEFTRAGVPTGSATVAVAGADRMKLDGLPSGTVAHVVVWLHAPGDAPVALDLLSTRLDVITVQGRRLDALVPTRLSGVLTAPGRAVQRVDLYFALPPSVTPASVSALRLRWRVVAGAGEHEARTPFARGQGGRFWATPARDPFTVGPVGRFDVATRAEPYRTRVTF